MNSADTFKDDLIKREPHPDAKPLGAFSLGEEILARESHGMKSGKTDSWRIHAHSRVSRATSYSCG